MQTSPVKLTVSEPTRVLRILYSISMSYSKPSGLWLNPSLWHSHGVKGRLQTSRAHHSCGLKHGLWPAPDFNVVNWLAVDSLLVDCYLGSRKRKNATLRHLITFKARRPVKSMVKSMVKSVSQSSLSSLRLHHCEFSKKIN